MLTIRKTFVEFVEANSDVNPSLQRTNSAPGLLMQVNGLMDECPRRRHSATVDYSVQSSPSGSSTSHLDDSLTTPSNSGEAMTTIVVRNIPTSYTRSRLTTLLDKEGFSGCYNFLYLPIKFRKKVAFGYAFVNLVSQAETYRFREHFCGFSNWGEPGGFAAEVEYCKAYQGLEYQIERYRNSPLLLSSAPDEMKPILLRNGSRIPFPGPTIMVTSCDTSALFGEQAENTKSMQRNLLTVPSPSDSRQTRISSWADCSDKDDGDVIYTEPSQCSTRCSSSENAEESSPFVDSGESYPKLGRKARRTIRKLMQAFGAAHMHGNQGPQEHQSATGVGSQQMFIDPPYFH